MVPGIPELVHGKLFILHLRLLHAKHGRAMSLKPRDHDMKARTDGVHVVCGYFENTHFSPYRVHLKDNMACHTPQENFIKRSNEKENI
jgi:hypothetical protein